MKYSGQECMASEFLFQVFAEFYADLTRYQQV